VWDVRAVVVRCPNCNANLQVQSTVVSTTCSYCGTVSRIQARTAMFQIPKPPAMPVQSANMTNAERLAQLQQLAKMPVAVQRASIFLALLPFVLMAVIAGGVILAVRGAGGFGGALGGGSRIWAGHPPAVTDLDGDKVPDLIGLVRYVTSNDRAHFAAISGKTGAELWESDPIGSYSDVSQDQFGAVGDTLYVATKDGKLVARNVKNKAVVKWEISLGEKIEAMCAAGNELAVTTADQKWWLVDAGGKKREGQKLYRLDRDYTNKEAKLRFEGIGGESGDVCLPVSWNRNGPVGLFVLPGWSDMANIDGMDVEMLIKRAGGPSVAIGHKQPGTSVPLLARLTPYPEQTPMPKKGWRTPKEDKELLPTAAWKVEVPAVDPLNSRLDKAHVTLSDKAVYALYSVQSSNHHLTAFDLATGKRLWDREIPHGSGFVVVGLTLVGDVVAVTTWSSLTGYDVANGNERYRVGRAD